MPDRSKKIPYACKVCGKIFAARLRVLRTHPTRGRCCSKRCSDVAQQVPLEDRFWEYVGRKTEGGCVLWAGGLNQTGYGVLYSSVANKTVSHYAHRVAYELMVGPIPEGLFILHRCDNPPCVNPVHLRAGTQLENIADRNMKGRQAKGYGHGHSKLTDPEVLSIRARFAAGERVASIARDTRLDFSTVHGIVRRKSWKHV